MNLNDWKQRLCLLRYFFVLSGDLVGNLAVLVEQELLPSP